MQSHLVDPSAFKETGITCRIQPSLFIQVQSRRIYRACGAQIHTILHHTLEKRRFDSWFLAQLDGSYLFFLTTAFQNQNNKNWKHMERWNKTKMTCSALSPQPRKSIWLQMPFDLFIESVNLVRDWGEQKEVILTEIRRHYVQQPILTLKYQKWLWPSTGEFWFPSSQGPWIISIQYT